jgi:hypothetical protein
MKQIQKIISNLRFARQLSQKDNKKRETQLYLDQKRQQYLASAPVGFKTRANSDYFFQ